MKQLLTILLLSFFRLTFCQGDGTFFKAFVGNPTNEVVSQFGASSFLGSDENNNFYYLNCNMTMFNPKPVYSVEKYSKLMNPIQNKEQKYRSNQATVKVNLLSFQAGNKGYFLIVDESGDKASVKAAEIDKPTLNLLTDNAKQVSTTDKSVYYRTSVDRELICAADSTRFAVISTTKEGSLSKISKRHVSVFDNQLNVLWENDIKSPLVEREFTITSYSLGSDGSLYMLLLYSAGKEAPYRSWAGLDYSKLIWKVMKIKGDDVKIFDIKLKEGDISSIQINVNKEGLIFTGFYSAGKGENIIGVFTISMDAGSGLTINETVKPLTNGFLTDKVKILGGNVSDWLINIGKIMPLSNGGFIFTAEQEFRVDGAGSHSTRMEGDLAEICVKVSNSNTIAWVTKISKSYLKTGYTNSAINNSFVVDDVLYVLYKDNIDNLNITDDKGIKQAADWGSKEALIIAKIEEDGTLKREAVPVAQNVQKFSVSYLQRLDNRTYLIPGIRSNDPYQMMAISIK